MTKGYLLFTYSIRCSKASKVKKKEKIVLEKNDLHTNLEKEDILYFNFYYRNDMCEVGI